MKKALLFSEALKLNDRKAFHVMVKPHGPICNLDCTYCYYLEKKTLYPGKHDMKMSEETLEEFIRQYIGVIKVPVVQFTWQGGEPTLMGIDFFKKAVALQKKYAGGKRIENSFQTNGTRLDDDWGRFFHDNNFLIGISIDGPEHNHDHHRKTVSGKPTFKQVMHGVELLQKHRVEFNTLSCVNSFNVADPLETYRFLKGIGSIFMQFIPIVERKKKGGNDQGLTLVSNEFEGDALVTEWSVRGTDYGKFLITIFDEWVKHDVGRYFVPTFDAALANLVGALPGICVFAETCGDGLVMEHNGDVYMCDHYVYPEFYLGNIHEKPIAEMAGSPEQFNFGVNKRYKLPEYCMRCKVRYACNGECPKHRFLTTPDGEYGLNWLCDGYKAFYQHIEPYLKFMANELKAKRPPANVMQWVRNREQVMK
jgi:uncharacterized protein